MNQREMTRDFVAQIIPAILLVIYVFAVGTAVNSTLLAARQCGTNAAAVGLATTSAVVTGITWIIASDGIFAVICSALHI